MQCVSAQYKKKEKERMPEKEGRKSVTSVNIVVIFIQALNERERDGCITAA